MARYIVLSEDHLVTKNFMTKDEAGSQAMLDAVDHSGKKIYVCRVVYTALVDMEGDESE